MTREEAQKELVKSNKRQPQIGEKITFIRFGKIVKKSTNWITKEKEKGMSVYSINSKGAAEQTIRAEFLERETAYIGQGTVIGYGSDSEPLVIKVREIRKATEKDIDLADFYGIGKKAWLEYLDKFPKSLSDIA